MKRPAGFKCEDARPTSNKGDTGSLDSASRPPGELERPSLWERETIYRQIIESTHEGVWMADLHGVTTFVNPQMARMLGCEPREIVGRTVFDFVSVEDHAAVRGHFGEYLQLSHGKEVEERLRRKDGTELWTMVSASVFKDGLGRPVGFLGMFTDITPRKRMEQALNQSMATLETRVLERTGQLEASHKALAESEEKFRRLFETISDAALVFDAETGQCVEVNEAALSLYGYSREEFLRITHQQVSAEPRDTELSIRLVASGGSPRIPLRYHRKKDGSVFPVDISAGSFRYKGRPIVCGIVRDITQRKRAEEAIMRNRELEREVVAVSEHERQRLGQDLHDDLCQQLAGIEFLSQGLAGKLASRKARESRQALEIARMVQQAMGRTRELARGLSPVGLDEEGLSDALRELAARTSGIYGCDCRLCGRAPVVVQDPALAFQLYRIAQESVANAVKHGRPRVIEIRVASVSGAIELVVEDDGVGIPGGRVKGKGMGLRFMKYRAEVLGGTLTVRPGPNGGTVVTCRVKPKPAAAQVAKT